MQVWYCQHLICQYDLFRKRENNPGPNLEKIELKTVPMQKQPSRSEPKQGKLTCIPSLYLAQTSSGSSAIAKHSTNTSCDFCIKPWKIIGWNVIIIILQQLKQSLKMVLARERVKIGPKHTITPCRKYKNPRKNFTVSKYLGEKNVCLVMKPSCFFFL